MAKAEMDKAVAETDKVMAVIAAGMAAETVVIEGAMAVIEGVSAAPQVVAVEVAGPCNSPYTYKNDIHITIKGCAVKYTLLVNEKVVLRDASGFSRNGHLDNRIEAARSEYPIPGNLSLEASWEVESRSIR